MNPRSDKKKYQGPSIGVKKVARRAGNKRIRGENYEPPCIKRSRQVDKMLGRLGIITNNSREENLKAIGGGGDNATVMGQGPARTMAS